MNILFKKKRCRNYINDGMEISDDSYREDSYERNPEKLNPSEENYNEEN